MHTVPTKSLRSMLLVLMAATLALAPSPASALDAGGTQLVIAASDAPAEEGDIAKGTFCGMDWRISGERALILGADGQEQALAIGGEVTYDS